MSKDYEILWDNGPCDSICIHYAEWPYLQYNQLVDVETHYEHIKLVPKQLVESPDFITKCLETIIRKNGRLHYTKCDEEFLIATGNNFKISDFFDFEEDQMKEFLSLKKGLFVIDADGYVTVGGNGD